MSREPVQAPARDTAPVLLAADSFRVRVVNGTAEVRGFARHLRRFSETARAAWRDVDPEATAHAVAERLAAFVDDAREQIAEAGAGFPRLELWADPAEPGILAPSGPRGESRGAPRPRLSLSLRPLPELGDRLALASAQSPSLPHADRKGPHIAHYAALSRSLGAEPLLLDAAGRAVEGGTTSLLWWPSPVPGSAGYLSASTHRVPSVTEALMRIASRQSPAFGTLRPGWATVPELRECEVWTVNALHGIRPVTHIDGHALPAPEPDRLSRFRAALDRGWEPVRAADGRR